ncbi:MAG: hypothetical protein LC135_06110 [Phycisphaerae bacterium]|nr:hypothetical protein [Phycisphaerae bacterium]MCZ2399431.1 hypothetical protein [Phycisphaerae bacterium]NUQ49039.1 hypothetical protein [Phycisphaerae bacterium]
MRRNASVGRGLGWLAVVGLLAAWGCEGSQPRRAPAARTDAERTARLVERARILWQARQDEDWSRTFDFRDPRVAKAEDREKYIEWCRENEPIAILAHRVLGGQVEGHFGWVQVESTKRVRRYPAAAAQQVRQWERWRWVGEDWYPVPAEELSLYPDAPAARDREGEQRLKERFEEAWQCRLKRDYEKLYALTDPEDHEEVKFDMLVADESQFEHLSKDVEFIEVIGDRGRILVAYTVKLTDPSVSKQPPQEILINERWIRRDGQWYRELNLPK